MARALVCMETSTLARHGRSMSAAPAAVQERSRLSRLSGRGIQATARFFIRPQETYPFNEL